MPPMLAPVAAPSMSAGFRSPPPAGPAPAGSRPAPAALATVELTAARQTGAAALTATADFLLPG